MARGHERGIGDESSIAAIDTRFGPGFRVTWHEPSYTSCLARLTRWLPAEETHAMTTKIFRIEGFILAATLVACGGGGGTKATVATFCDDKATAECDGVASRCLATDTACKAARVTACNAFVAAVQNPTTRPFQSDKITDCINKTKDVYKKATITPADRATMDAACQRVFSGVKVKNDPCVSDYECDTSLFCDISLAAPVCASKSTVASMDFCNNPGETCPTGQYCAAGASRMCMARATMGLACATVPCLETLRCTAAGTCAEKVVLAGACTADSDCATTAPYCDTYNGSICDAGFTPAPGTKECVQAFAGTDTSGGAGGAGGAG